MTKLINFGVASEETKGSEVHSINLDGSSGKKLEGTIRYRAASEAVADMTKVVDQA